MSTPTNSRADSAYPLVTIAIPTRNRASLLKNCVASALAQTYSNIEVLVSDNASTDDTLETLRSFNDPRLRILTNSENIGLTGNFNKCVYGAAGDYLNIISDDNLLQPKFLEMCVALVKEEPGLPIVVGAYDVVVSAENRIVPIVVSKRLQTGIWDGIEILKEHLRGKLAYEPLSSIIRTDIFRKFGGFPVEYECTGDELVIGRILLEGGRAGLVNEACASFLMHTENFSFGHDGDYRFKDMCGVMIELSKAAGRVISNETTRREIQRLTKRYLAYKALQELAVCRQQGSSLYEVARQFWNWRGILGQCTLGDFLTSLRLRSVGRILLPTPVVRLGRMIGIS
jgi:glycosyltransferase involved in cell wall biosynthesis